MNNNKSYLPEQRFFVASVEFLKMGPIVKKNIIKAGQTKLDCLQSFVWLVLDLSAQ